MSYFSRAVFDSKIVHFVCVNVNSLKQNFNVGFNFKFSSILQQTQCRLRLTKKKKQERQQNKKNEASPQEP